MRGRLGDERIDGVHGPNSSNTDRISTCSMVSPSLAKSCGMVEMPFKSLYAYTSLFAFPGPRVA